MNRFLAWLRSLFGTRRRPAPVPTPQPTPKPVPVPPTPPKPVEPAPAPPTPPPVVTPPPLPGSTEPVYIGGVHKLLWRDEFNGPNPIARYTLMDGESGLSIEAGAGANGSSALRIQWQARTNGQDDAHLVETSWEPARELFLSFTARWPKGFVWSNPAQGGNAKKVLLVWSRTGSRWLLINENGFFGIGNDSDHPLHAQNVGAAISPDEMADGQYHRLTFRIKSGTTPETNDGEMDGYVDGQQKWRIRDWVSRSGGGYYLAKYPTTFNKGSPVTQHEYLSEWSFWTV